MTVRVWLVAGATLAACGAGRPLAAQTRVPPDFGDRGGPLRVELEVGEPVSLFLELARELHLREPQRKQLIEIRRRLRGQNQPYMERLDSLRLLTGVELGPRRRISREDEDALARFNTAARPTLDSIRVNNDIARAEAHAALDTDQRSRMDSIVKALETDQPRRGRRRPG
jgi:hypothetical protein